jgi:hypothetical protein
MFPVENINALFCDCVGKIRETSVGQRQRQFLPGDQGFFPVKIESRKKQPGK